MLKYWTSKFLGQTDRQTDRPTDRQTKQGIEAPCRSLKIAGASRDQLYEQEYCKCLCRKAKKKSDGIMYLWNTVLHCHTSTAIQTHQKKIGYKKNILTQALLGRNCHHLSHGKDHHTCWLIHCYVISSYPSILEYISRQRARHMPQIWQRQPQN